MQKTSAGILLYRLTYKVPEFFLVHPGGPFFYNKQAGYWTIPKGEPEEGESLADCARREFYEETGSHPTANMHALSPVRQKAGKLVYAWLVQGDIDAKAIRSNLFTIPWPPGSSNLNSFLKSTKENGCSLTKHYR